MSVTQQLPFKTIQKISFKSANVRLAKLLNTGVYLR